MLNHVIKRLKSKETGHRYPPPHMALRNTLEVRNIEFFKKAMGWVNTPILDDPQIWQFKFYEDLNERRVRDAEIIGTACANTCPKVLLEIGTALGHGTALMAQNAPGGIVYTVNLLPEDIEQGGTFTSFAPSKEEIGQYYRERGLSNIRQVYANTAFWEPDLGLIDLAFIDGCHDSEFVFNDTCKILKNCRPGSIIMWHDFNPKLMGTYAWIESVCRGVERLYVEGLIKGPILHLQDSWVGLYQVPLSGK